ncbi:hypothetical protein OROGR_026922 [Orobanche gracilis]
MEEWDAEFLEEFFQIEERTLSTQPLRHPLPPPKPPRDVSFSPPRELSQRTNETYHTGIVPDSIVSFDNGETHFSTEQENDMLKRELHGVSKHLHQLEEEILELRKERDKKEEQLKVLHSKIEAKDAELSHTKNADIRTAPGTSTAYQDANTPNKIGSSRICSSEKLFRLWNSDDKKQGKVLVAKLFMTCEAEFHVLFGYLNSPQEDSNKGTQTIEIAKKGTRTIETAKISQLYSVLTKLQISTDTLILGDLLGALADLCSLKNVVIVRSSTHILLNVLRDSFNMEKEFGKSSENVIVEEHFYEDIKSDTNGSGDPENDSLCLKNVAEMLKQGQIFSGLKLSNVKTPSGHTGFFDQPFGRSISGVLWVSVFEIMCLVAAENTEEQIRLEALSVMNLILMRQNAYSERDKFAGKFVFRCLSQLLGRCGPKVIPMLCSGFEEDGECARSNDINEKSTSTFHGFHEILIGLADCVAGYGSYSAQEMRLRRNAISLLAFVVSAGKSGFEIVLNHKPPKGTNFFAIILRSLASDLDPRALNSVKESGTVKELCLLIRETLIFLNRLVSHSDYCAHVLQALTDTREMASMTVDVANRLTHTSNLLWKDIRSKTHIRESEIMELANVFKKRVFMFLRDIKA